MDPRMDSKCLTIVNQLGLSNNWLHAEALWTWGMGAWPPSFLKSSGYQKSECFIRKFWTSVVGFEF